MFPFQRDTAIQLCQEEEPFIFDDDGVGNAQVMEGAGVVKTSSLCFCFSLGK
jgi:hypothetical protein